MDISGLKALGLSVRALSMDGVQAANSGHPGLPLGMADFGAVLYGEILKHYPEAPEWINRDRFILSAGHGSMFLYSLLHLTGYNLPMDQLKKFRQLGSITPGHPEYGMTPGVETTTGPLGAGLSNAVGFAIAETRLAAEFNTPGYPIIDHFTYALAGDGCLMEGVASEAASLAGHLGLGKLITIYDSNRITIEGHTDLAFTEDVGKRFEAYGWQVLRCDAYEHEAMAKTLVQAQAERSKPSLIILRSTIGFGSPNKAGSHEVHGAPLGKDEILAARKALGIPEDQDFYVAPGAISYVKERQNEWKKSYETWSRLFSDWALKNPELKKKYDLFFSQDQSWLNGFEEPQFQIGDSVATRVAGGKALQAAAKAMPWLLGGSADLGPSNNTALPYGDYSKEDRKGRTIHFGVREHAMGGILNGMVLHGGVKAFGATFLVFADYMRPPIRLAALMKIPTIFLFTHDSIFVGEDGPTHQPIEHYATLRAIPDLLVLRPADAQETVEAWKLALTQKNRPTALLETRQNLKVFQKPDNWKEYFRKGAYIAQAGGSNPGTVILATGSEVTLAIEASALSGKEVRVISITSFELLRENPDHLKTLIPPGAKVLGAESGITQGWEALVPVGNHLGINRFGESGPGSAVAAHLGLTAQDLAKRI